MKKILMYSHTGSCNHGCEALVRSTVKILQNRKFEFVLDSLAADEDIKYGIDKICTVRSFGKHARAQHFSLHFLKAWLALRIKKDYTPMDMLGICEYYGVKKGDIAISIGGDNYCYDYIGFLKEELDIWKYCGLKTILWGCSIDQEVLCKRPEIIDEIKMYDLISARESISYEILKCINPNTVLVADSAFYLTKKELSLPENFQNKNYIGINLSPLVSQYANQEMVFANYCQLINFILTNTEYNIMLIPHVIKSHDDDRWELRKLLDFFNNERIIMIDDNNCEVLKGYISRASFFVGSRTHAVIAAYSEFVPTLAVGYSTKSMGIAKDIFGEYEKYVVPVQKLKDDMELTESFKWIMKNEKIIINKLKDVVPNYKKRISRIINKL